MSKYTQSIKKSRLIRFLVNRIKYNRDAKVLITSRNSETGTGKTTLAVIIAKLIDMNGWSHEKQFFDAQDYMQYYRKAESGSVLILDDMQFMADSRRGTSHENVRLSQYWSIMRTRNVISIATLPTNSLLDKRFLELADVRINVIKRGQATPYRIVVNDFTGKVTQWRFRFENGTKETIYFKSMDDDPDYREVERKKDIFVRKKLREMYQS